VLSRHGRRDWSRFDGAPTRTELGREGGAGRRGTHLLRLHLGLAVTRLRAVPSSAIRHWRLLRRVVALLWPAVPLLRVALLLLLVPAAAKQAAVLLRCAAGRRRGAVLALLRVAALLRLLTVALRLVVLLWVGSWGQRASWRRAA